jgi:hypothetical protein
MIDTGEIYIFLYISETTMQKFLLIAILFQSEMLIIPLIIYIDDKPNISI